MKTIELFAGTRSFSKVAKALGHQTFTTDYEEIDGQDLVADIQNLETTDFPYCQPDILWASPPVPHRKRNMITRKRNMITLEQIVDELETQTLFPERAAELLIFLAVKYARAADNLLIAKAEYAKEFTNVRNDFKSDTAAERFLDYKEVGLTVAKWKYQRDKADTLINSLKAFIYQKGKEAKNEM